MSKDRPVALITGAGRGIGRACALELAKRGYRLFLVARTIEDLRETARLVGEARVSPLDISDPCDARFAVATAAEGFGRIDAIVHCAGYAPVTSVEEMSDDQWQEVIDTNLSAAFYLANAGWPHFKRRGGGVIVNISSLASRDPFPGFAAYGAAKAGLNVFDLVLAREGEPHGIRVHTIAPGAVETAMFRSILTPEQYPKEKTLDPADVAKVVADCVVGDLRYCSGEVIYLHKTV